MMNWKYFLAATVMTSTLFAQFKVHSIGDGNRIILKDKDGKELELKSDETKWTVEILDNSIDKLVLKGQSQIKFKTENQEVIVDAVQVQSKLSNGNFRVYLEAPKEASKQDLDVSCYVTQTVRGQGNSELKVEKGTVECIKTSGCENYVLGANKKFKLTKHNGICLGKQEVEVSAPTQVDETISCMLYNKDASDNSKSIAAKLTYTRALENLKERDVRKTAASSCK